MKPVFVMIKCNPGQVQTLSGVADTFTVITFNAFTVPQHGKK